MGKKSLNFMAIYSKLSDSKQSITLLVIGFHNIFYAFCLEEHFYMPDKHIVVYEMVSAFVVSKTGTFIIFECQTGTGLLVIT